MGRKIPAFEMIQHSVNIMRGCFGVALSARLPNTRPIIQNRSEDSIIREVERNWDTSPAFTGVISDLVDPPPICGGWPARQGYRGQVQEAVLPRHLQKPEYRPDTVDFTKTYGPSVPGVKSVNRFRLRYDLAVDPEYVKELVTHHVGGYLKIAPEHTEDGPLVT